MAVLRCPSCGAESPADRLEFECSCGDLLDVEHRIPAGISRETFDRRLAQPGGVWRFRELVDPGFPSDSVISLREGDTPLYASPRVAEYTDTRSLWLKHEGLNPTGSFKDRGMTVAVSRAVDSGAGAVACASTGNTAASVAAYAAHAGVRAIVLVPRGKTALGKLSQAMAFGARTVEVSGDFDHALALVRKLCAEGEVALLNSVNPFRIEGQKTIVFEILQQLEWRAPDWIVFPAGNLGNCAAFGKALREAREAGLIASTPRLAAVQAAGAAPFAAAFERGFDELRPVEAETIASAIRIGEPVSYARAVRSIRETNGIVLAVTDDEILDAKSIVDSAGIGAEPASCAAVAGVRKLALRGVIDGGETVVCVLTGNLLKDPETTIDYHASRLAGVTPKRANPPISIDGTLEELRRIVGGEG